VVASGAPAPRDSPRHRGTGLAAAASGHRTWYVNLRSAGDVDDDVRAWLTEAYLDSPE
jgi:hypothetical protein